MVEIELMLLAHTVTVVLAVPTVIVVGTKVSTVLVEVAVDVAVLVTVEVNGVGSEVGVT